MPKKTTSNESEKFVPPTPGFRRIPQDKLEELIQHDGRLSSGPINEMGIVRLALDLKEAREYIKSQKEDK